MAALRRGCIRRLFVSLLLPAETSSPCRSQSNSASRLVELGVLSPYNPPTLGYESGQVFVHNAFGYRGIILLPWKTKLMNITDKTSQGKEDKISAGATSREVKPEECYYYLVMIDNRDLDVTTHLKRTRLHILPKIGRLGMMGYGSNDRDGDLDFVSHDDVIPYTSSEVKPVQHHLFDYFFQLSSTKVVSGKSDLWRLAEKMAPILQLSQVSMKTTEDIQVTALPVYVGPWDNPERDFHWHYTIRIIYKGDSKVFVRERHLNIYCKTGNTEDIRGRMIASEEPMLDKQCSVFQYSSSLTLPDSGHLSGHYRIERSDGTRMSASIPLVKLLHNRDIRDSPLDIKR